MIKYVAHITLELQSPLCIASGLENSYSDTQVRRDFNNLPVIPGTSLKGLIKSLASKEAKEYLGKDADNGNLGSSLVVSDALLVNSQGKIHTQIDNSVFEDHLLKQYQILPNREHVRINHLGVAEDQGKFTNAIVHSGSRFQLQLKLEASKAIDTVWEEMLNLLYTADFLIGSQVTNGLGRVKPITVTQRKFNLKQPEDLKAFIELTPYAAIHGEEFIPTATKTAFTLHEEFMFTTDAIHTGAGYGDDEVNMANVIEKVIHWKSNHEGAKAEDQYIIPGASIKGVLRHRTFYYLCLAYNWATESASLSDYAKQQETAQAQLETLFGSASENEDGHIGNVIIEDVCIPETAIAETIFQHNSIDRFTGGTLDKMLFSEKVYAINEPVSLKIWLQPKENIAPETLEAFKKAIADLKNGQLALGGNTTNGNGFLKVTAHGK